ncbi:MAG TPA: hypothetical protein VKF80_06795 [Candidatus Eisenbacteria bacterium]|nr:hypothetical protein [Candidatus Eisenbacteria bacterium]
MTPDVETELQSLRAEISGLKRRSALLTIGVAASLGVAVATWVVLGNAPTPAYIAAKGFLVRDAGGKTRAILGVASNGSASLAITDDAGAPRASLSVDGGGSPQLALTTRDNASTLIGAQRIERPGQFPGERQIENRNAASIVVSDAGRGLFWSVP